MLFNSYGFIFLFVPIVVAVFATARAISLRLALVSLTAASLVFYSIWNIEALPILLISLAFNYSIGVLIARKAGSQALYVTIFGVACNLLYLAYFKYFNFSVEAVNALLGCSFLKREIDLPIGYSLFE